MSKILQEGAIVSAGWKQGEFDNQRMSKGKETNVGSDFEVEGKRINCFSDQSQGLSHWPTYI
jgi:hypothetical protein